jgi:hypothetical protein
VIGSDLVDPSDKAQSMVGRRGQEHVMDRLGLHRNLHSVSTTEGSAVCIDRAPIEKRVA